MKLIMRIITLCILLLNANFSNSKSIMLVNSYHAAYPWSIDSRSGFENNIGAQHQITYSEMDTKRIPQIEFQQRASKIWQEINTINPDLIVTMDDNALKYLGQRIANEEIPIVFMGINDNPRKYFNGNQLPNNVAGVLERPLVKQNILLISKLLPKKSGRILLMMDNSMTSQAIIESSMKGLKTISAGDFELDSVLIKDYQEWENRIKSLTNSNYDALIITSFAKLNDKAGQAVPFKSTLKWTSSNSPIPIFSLGKHTVGKGKAIGGLLLTSYEQGKKAAEIANKTLESGTIPYHVVPKQGRYLFSEHELSRWNITLPEEITHRANFIE